MHMLNLYLFGFASDHTTYYIYDFAKSHKPSVTQFVYLYNGSDYTNQTEILWVLDYSWGENNGIRHGRSYKLKIGNNNWLCELLWNEIYKY